MVKRKDALLFAIIAFLLGFFLISQYRSGLEVQKVIQPENNQVLAIEVSKLTKGNAELRQEVVSTDAQVAKYQSSVTNQSVSTETINKELKYYRELNGIIPITGKGVILTIDRPLTQPQVVDLANTIRNIGVKGFSINGERVGVNYHFQTSDINKYDIVILGNPTLIRSALIRKGGFLEQLFPNSVEYSIKEEEILTLNTNPTINFTYSKVIK